MDVKITDFTEPEDPKIANRFGMVKFSHYWLGKTDLEFRRKLYQVITPIRSLYDETQFQDAYDKMICYSELFEEIELGVRYPEYLVTIDNEDKITVQKV